MNDAGRIGFIIRGNYSGTETYEFLDVIYYNGSSYVAKKTTIGNIPVEDDEFWHIFARGSLSPVTGVKGEAETQYRHGDVNITPENIGALSENGDSSHNTITFESGDTVDPSVWVDVDVLSSGEEHSSIFKKISNIFRNVRFLRKIIGTTSISEIGDGTVTGAIHDLNTDLYGVNSNISSINTNISDLTTALSGKQSTADAVKIGIFYRSDSVGAGATVTIDAAAITGITANRFLAVCPFLVTTNHGIAYGRVRGKEADASRYYIDSTHANGDTVYHKCVYFYK